MSAPLLVEARGLAYGYDGARVLEGVDLAVPEGSLWAVLGPNGAGKTTLLKLLLGLLRPSAGELKVAGARPRRGNPMIGYGPQRRALDPDLPVRGRDLVALGLDGHRWGLPAANRHRRQRTDAALDAVGARELASLPVGRLSGGEQQRLLVAQALVGRPRLLLLDEPLANLDLHHQADVVELVDRVRRNEGVTVLLVAHDVNPLLGHAESVLYLAGGRAASGPPEAVIRSEVLTQLYGVPVEVFAVHGRLFVAAAPEVTP